MTSFYCNGFREHTIASELSTFDLNRYSSKEPLCGLISLKIQTFPCQDATSLYCSREAGSVGFGTYDEVNGFTSLVQRKIETFLTES